MPDPAATFEPARVHAVGPQNLRAAAAALAAVKGASKLNIRAGEHVAGMALTAFNGPPATVDVDGGIDFVFDRTNTPLWPWELGDAACAGVEVKSFPGGYRRHEAHEDLGDTYRVEIRRTADLVVESSEQIVAAIDALKRKAKPDRSRHAFVLFHALDGVVQEIFEDHLIMPHRLPTPRADLELDSLWLMFHRFGLVKWTSADQVWSVLVLGARAGDEPPPPEDDGDDWSAAEARFLESIGNHDGSPWLYDFS